MFLHERYMCANFNEEGVMAIVSQSTALTWALGWVRGSVKEWVMG